jgi:hypothetical protein
MDPRWSTTLFWGGLAVPAWLGAVLSTTLAIPEALQPDQARWVAVVAGLVAVPIIGAAFGCLVAFAVTRRLRPGVTVAAVTLLCMSVLLAFVVVPKAP